jgi:hypothetical protein
MGRERKETIIDSLGWCRRDGECKLKRDAFTLLSDWKFLHKSMKK